MSKNTNILANVDIDDAIAAALEDGSIELVEGEDNSEDADLAREQAEQVVKEKGIAPFDLFGDASLSGEQKFTEEMLPVSIYNYAVDAAKRPGLNPGPIAVGCLAAAAEAIRAGWKIQPKPTDPEWTEKPILWVGITGSSGAKKSHVLKASLKPLKLIEAEWARENDDLLKDYFRLKAEHNEEMKVWRAARKSFEVEKVNVLRSDGKAAADEMKFDLPFPEKPQPPIMRRMIMEDITSEAVLKVCAVNPAGVLIERDEITEWIASFDMYAGGSGARDQAFYLTAYNGGSRTKDRAGDEGGPLRADTLATSILGGIQDDIVQKKFSKMAHDGFLARFLFVKAEILPGSRDIPDAEAAKAYFHLIGSLAGMEVEEENGEDGIVQMSPEASEVRENVEAIALALNDHPSICKGLSDHINKWPGIFSRLCLIFHMIWCVENRRKPNLIAVRKETADRAYNLLLNYFLPEAARIYNDVMEGGDEQEQHARWIAGHILAHKKDRISTYDIRRAFSSIANDDWALKKATSTLEIMAWITPDTKRDGSPYSRTDFAKMKWRVNPAVHEMFADQAAREEKRRRDVQEKIAAGAEVIRKLRSR